MKKLSTILQLPIMEVLNGAEVGRTKEILMNMATKEIVFVLNQSTVTNLYVIKAEDLVGIGRDVMLIKTIQSIQNTQADKELADLLGEYYSISGLDVITMAGDIEGKVVDIAIDESQKKMLQLELANDRTFDVSKIVSISDKYIFIQESDDIEVGEAPATEFNSVQDSLESEASEGETSYLIGMVLNETVANEEGTFVVEIGTTLTKELIDQADEHGVLTSLIMNVE